MNVPERLVDRAWRRLVLHRPYSGCGHPRASDALEPPGQLAAHLRRILVGVEPGDQVQGAVTHGDHAVDAGRPEGSLVDVRGVANDNAQPRLGGRLDLDDVAGASEPRDVVARLLRSLWVTQLGLDLLGLVEDVRDRRRSQLGLVPGDLEVLLH